MIWTFLLQSVHLESHRQYSCYTVAVPSRQLSYLLDVGLSVLQVSVNGYLLLVSKQSSISSCAWPVLGSGKGAIREIETPPEWEVYAFLLLNFIMLDFFVLIVLWDNRPSQTAKKTFHDPALSMLLAGWLTTRLETIVDNVDKMTEPVVESWPTGQLTAMLGLIAVAIEVWEYLKGKGPTNNTIPRYQLWWSQSKTLLHLSKLI